MAHMVAHEARIETRRLLDRAGVERPDDGTVELFSDELALCARRLHRINMRRCNGIPDGFHDNGESKMRWNDDDESEANEQEERYLERAQAALHSLLGSKRGLARLEYNSDPRGAPLTIDMVGGEPRVATFY